MALGGAAAAVDEAALDACGGAAAAAECGAVAGEEMDGCLSCSAHSQHTERDTQGKRRGALCAEQDTHRDGDGDGEGRRGAERGREGATPWRENDLNSDIVRRLLYTHSHTSTAHRQRRQRRRRPGREASARQRVDGNGSKERQGESAGVSRW
jgi:hypothetical protein